MKTIGMIGGMSWESTVSYYKALNRGVKEALGESHSAKIWLYSLDFEEIKTLLMTSPPPRDAVHGSAGSIPCP